MFKIIVAKYAPASGLQSLNIKALRHNRVAEKRNESCPQYTGGLVFEFVHVFLHRP